MSETDSKRETEVFFKTRSDTSPHQQQPESNDDSQMCTTPDNEDPDANTQAMQQCSASMAEEVKKMIIKQNELTEVLHGLTHVLAKLNTQKTDQTACRPVSRIQAYKMTMSLVTCNETRIGTGHIMQFNIDNSLEK